MGANPEEIEAALRRILQRPEFVASPRQQAFLRFIVDETLADRANRLKAFTIATSIFGRNESFDPQKNSIVRVEALRLRRLLDQYYDGVGANDPLQIRLRRGAYVPEFVRLPGAPEAEPTPGPEPAIEPPAPPRSPSWRWLLAACVIGVAAIGAVAVLSPNRQPTPTIVAEAILPRHSTISIPPFQVRGSTSGMQELAAALHHDIENKLSLFANPTVIEFDESRTPTDYRLTGALSPDGDETAALSLRVTRLISGKAGEIVWSRHYSGIALAGQNGFDSSSLTSTIGQSYGVIHADVRKRLRTSPTPSVSYDCVVLAYEAFDTPTKQRFDDAETCLRTVLAADPGFASGNAALSMLMVSRWLDAIEPAAPDDVLSQARRLARSASKASPMKGVTQTAKFWARFFSGRYEDAFEAARIALQLNPYSVDALGRVGAAHLLRGHTDEGVLLLEQAASRRVTIPSWQEFFLFLGAYLRDDDESARRYASRSDTSLSPLGLLARIVVANRSRDAVGAASSRRQLDRNFPAFAADIGKSLDRWSMLPAIRDRLLADLDAANAQPVQTR